jgi:colicin import membrane protein
MSRIPRIYCSLLTKIIIGVVAAHLLLFVGIAIRSSFETAIPIVQPKMVVQTIQIGEPPTIAVNEEISPFVSETIAELAPDPMPDPIPQPEQPPKPPQQAPEPQVKETPKPKPEKPAVAKKPEALEAPKTPKAPKPKVEAKKPEPKKVEKKKIAEKEKPKEVKKPVVKNESKKSESTKPKEVKAETIAAPPPPAPDPKVAAAKAEAKTKAEAEAKARKQKLMQSAKESLANIDKTAHKLTASNSSASSKIAPLARIEKLEIEALPANGTRGAALTVPEASYQASYRSELIHRLKLLLRLPEFGEVKVQLTLERSGRVAKVAIVSAESSANRRYIEKTLPGATFPGFGDNFGNEPQYTFLISLSNDI